MVEVVYPDGRARMRVDELWRVDPDGLPEGTVARIDDDNPPTYALRQNNWWVVMKEFEGRALFDQLAKRATDDAPRSATGEALLAERPERWMPRIVRKL